MIKLRLGFKILLWNFFSERIQSKALNNICFNRPLNELFFLWKLCGSTVESILIEKGIIRLKPPVLTIPW